MIFFEMESYLASLIIDVSTEEEAERQLLTLSTGKFKLLKKEPSGKEFASTDIFSVNYSFSNEKRRIKIPTITTKVSQKCFW